jgi:hypothetical protein
MKALSQVIFSARIVKSAACVSLVVGTILNVINQGTAIFGGSGVSWFHLFLNFLVPYCVASYSAAKNEMTRTSNE